MFNYWERRRYRNKNYYGQATEYVRKYAADAVSMIDIGNRGCKYIYEWNWISDKTVLDTSDEIYNLDDSVKKVQEDFLVWVPDREYDLVTCFQTLEHIQDPIPFINKLHEIQRGVLIISLPYMWPICKAPSEHQHDPISMDKIHNWLGTHPLEETIVTEDRGTERWMGVYGKPVNMSYGEHPPLITAGELPR